MNVAKALDLKGEDGYALQRAYIAVLQANSGRELNLHEVFQICDKTRLLTNSSLQDRKLDPEAWGILWSRLKQPRWNKCGIVRVKGSGSRESAIFYHDPERDFEKGRRTKMTSEIISSWEKSSIEIGAAVEAFVKLLEDKVRIPLKEGRSELAKALKVKEVGGTPFANVMRSLLAESAGDNRVVKFEKMYVLLSTLSPEEQKPFIGAKSKPKPKTANGEIGFKKKGNVLTFTGDIDDFTIKGGGVINQRIKSAKKVVIYLTLVLTAVGGYLAF